MARANVAGEPVTYQGRQYRAIREGLANILAPYSEKATSKSNQKTTNQSRNNDEGDQAVFYNPIQQYNRDLSVLAILTYGEGAMVSKETKSAKLVRTRKHKAEKKKRSENGSVHGAAVASELSKKRKADELEDLGETVMSNGKKVKNDQLADDDDELDVQQLEGVDEVSVPTENVTSIDNRLQNSTDAQQTSEEAKQKLLPFTILDALSASGLRAIRYAKEIPFATNVIANDLSSEAVKAIEHNIDYNELRGKVHSNVGDARAYMYSKVGNEHSSPSAGYVHRFDVIDLDPYGTAAPFLDSAIQALVDGGLLCVTCTDAGVFASNGYPEKAFALYGGVTMKGPFSHEAGLRLILHAIATSAAKYGIAIEPLLSLSIDFYARLFVRVHKQPHQVKLLAGTTMTTYSCDQGCGAWTTQLVARNQEKQDKIGQTIFKHGYAQAPSTQRLCDHCGKRLHLGGPMWAGPLHNPYFVQRILDRLPDIDRTVYQTVDRVKGMLTLALEEDLTMASSNVAPTTEAVATSKSIDTKIIPRMPSQIVDAAPFFFIPNLMAKVLHCATPPEDPIRGAIRHLGYQVTRSHCKAGSFKTTAPWDVLWEIMREWVRQESPIKEGKVAKGMPGWKILQKIRGTEAKEVMDVQNSIKLALERGIDGRGDLKSLLESGLYRLEHLKVRNIEDTTVDSDIQEQNGPIGENGGDSPKPAWNEQRDVSMLKVVFDADLGKDKPRGKLVRYQINPRANWGPMNRAGN